MTSNCIALLRGINVGGRNRVPMSELRDACAALGWSGVRTYIQSGNIVFHAAGGMTHAEEALEEAIADTFDLRIAVLVRSAAQWLECIAHNPFPVESAAEPRLVHLALAKQTPASAAASQLTGRAEAGERIVRVGDALYCHFPEGVGRSKLTPSIFDRCVGSPVTLRNWRTVTTLGDMASA
jgi:uncharacterized protein (DUF1697 family)